MKQPPSIQLIAVKALILNPNGEVLILKQSEAPEALWVGYDDVEALDILEPSNSIIKKLLSSQV